MSVRVRPVRPDDDADIAAIMDIYCFHITNEGDPTTFEDTLPSFEAMRARVKGLLRDGYPYIVAEVCGESKGNTAAQGSQSAALARGRVVGYTYVHLFRERAAYSRTVENSIYVHREARGYVGLRVGRGTGAAATAASLRRACLYCGTHRCAAGAALHGTGVVSAAS